MWQTLFYLILPDFIDLVQRTNEQRKGASR